MVCNEYTNFCLWTLFLAVKLVGKHNGRVFEERELTFPLGEGSDFGICEGLERALDKFKKGEKSHIALKSKYAFKREGKPELNIPPNADIEYEVELKNFERVSLKINKYYLKEVKNGGDLIIMC